MHHSDFNAHQNGFKCSMRTHRATRPSAGKFPVILFGISVAIVVTLAIFNLIVK